MPLQEKNLRVQHPPQSNQHDKVLRRFVTYVRTALDYGVIYILINEEDTHVINV